MSRLIRFTRLCTFLLILCIPAAPAFAADPSPEAIKEAVRRALKENPELVMDVLKENSELVLEIAQQGNALRKRKALLAQWEQDAKANKIFALQGRAFRGKSDAPVTIVAYSDFTCAYCRQMEYVILQLLRKYDGQIRVTFKALPKEDPFSLAAAKYSIAAFMNNQDKGWLFFDALFKGMEEYERDGDDFIKKIAGEAGLDFRKLKADAGGSAVQKRLDEDRKEADGFGIAGTPYFFVNNLMVRGAISQDLFEEAIGMALRQKRQ